MQFFLPLLRDGGSACRLMSQGHETWLKILLNENIENSFCIRFRTSCIFWGRKPNLVTFEEGGEGECMSWTSSRSTTFKELPASLFLIITRKIKIGNLVFLSSIQPIAEILCKFDHFRIFFLQIYMNDPESAE